MELFGLTGNIGCGKSTVAKLMVIQGGITVFDCDRIAKDIIAGDAIRQDMIKIVGEGVIAENNTINWKELAQIIFTNKAKKHFFENLVHPLVRETIARAAEELPPGMIGIVESAIIYETGWYDAFDGIVLAVCGHEEQMRRLKENRLMNEGDIERRLNTQLPQWEKANRADFIVSTDCSPQQLELNVIELCRQLKQFN